MPMPHAIRLIAPVLCLAAMPLSAQEVAPDKTAALFDALGLPEMLEVMRDEGLEYGTEIGSDLFGGRVTAGWTETVRDIYDIEVMREVSAAALTEALAGADVDAMLDFFGSDLGETIISLEIAGRRALLDPAVEEAAETFAATAMAEETPRYRQVREFVQTNDLVETNVVGALNSNYAFYIGLADGGALGQDLSEQQILADVWGQEDEIRANTTQWVYSFLLLAYQPLSDAELQSYIDFSQTEAGQDLNDALFSAFDGLFEDISMALGRASANYMAGEDI